MTNICYLEVRNKQSSKFWSIKVQGVDHTVHYGRIGTAGQKKTKTFPSAAAAQRDAERLIGEKRKKGYETKKKTTPKPRKARSAVRRRGGFVSSGRFREAIETFGKLKKRRKVLPAPHGFNKLRSTLPKKAAIEVDALFALYASYQVPDLCGLSVGSFFSKAAEQGLTTAEEVEDAEWFYSREDISLVLEGIEIYHDGPCPSVLLCSSGVYAFNEDPHGLVILADDFEAFLRVLTMVEAAACGKADVDSAEELMREHIYANDDETYEKFFARTLTVATELMEDAECTTDLSVEERLTSQRARFETPVVFDTLQAQPVSGFRDVLGVARWGKTRVTVHLGGDVYHGKKKCFTRRSLDAIATVDKETAWLAANDSVLKSTDLRTWKTILPPEQAKGFSIIAADGEGAIYVSKYDHNKRYCELLCSSDGKFFDTLVTTKTGKYVNFLSTTESGDVLVGWSHGRLTIARGGALYDTKLRARESPQDACITARGTLVVVMGTVAYRSEDGGRTFERNELKGRNIRTVQALPDGRIVAAGDRGRISVSEDDGCRYHKSLKAKKVDTRNPFAAFTTSSLIQNEVVLGGTGQPVVVVKLASS